MLRKKPFWQIVLLAFAVFFFSWLFVYKTGMNTLPIQSEDVLPAMFLPVAIIKDCTFYLDNYYDLLLSKYPHPDDRSFEKGLVPFYLEKVNEHYVSAFPLLPGILATPVYFFPIKFGIPINFENITLLAHVAAAFIMALCGGFMYKLLREAFSLEEKNAKLLTYIYLFGTINFALISQALWQHGAVQLFTILALRAIYKNRLFPASFFLGFAILSRPTAGVIAVILILAQVRTFWKKQKLFGVLKGSLNLFLGILSAILFFLWYNNAFYGDVSNQGYASQIFSEWRGRFPEGFLGLWLSPSKGILIYSPVFTFSFIGLYFAIKNRVEKKFDYIVFALIALIYTLIMGKWKHWYGGYSFGYRMAADIIPFLILLLVPAVFCWGMPPRAFSQYIRKYMFWVLVALSIVMQAMGIVFFDGIWHGIHDTGFVNTTWLWSLKDSETVFNFRRVLSKFWELKKAR